MSTKAFEQVDFNGLLDVKNNLLISKEEKQKNKTGIQLHSPYQVGRGSVETFIWKGFKKHYQADIQHFLPNLISIGPEEKAISALGFRSAARTSLFIEQYLDLPIESYFQNESYLKYASCFKNDFYLKDEYIKRHQIAEIGNLYGTNKLMTCQLFVITALALSRAGFIKLVFCATPQVKTTMQALQMTTQFIAKADPERIGSQIDCWGEYYKTSPELLAIDLRQAEFLISQSSHFSKMAGTFSNSIKKITNDFVL